MLSEALTIRKAQLTKHPIAVMLKSIEAGRILRMSIVKSIHPPTAPNNARNG
jgi:hypothetical protein